MHVHVCQGTRKRGMQTLVSLVFGAKRSCAKCEGHVARAVVFACAAQGALAWAIALVCST